MRIGNISLKEGSANPPSQLTEARGPERILMQKAMAAAQTPKVPGRDYLASVVFLANGMQTMKSHQARSWILSQIRQPNGLLPRMVLSQKERPAPERLSYWANVATAAHRAGSPELATALTDAAMQAQQGGTLLADVAQAQTSGADYFGSLASLATTLDATPQGRPLLERIAQVTAQRLVGSNPILQTLPTPASTIGKIGPQMMPHPGGTPNPPVKVDPLKVVYPERIDPRLLLSAVARSLDQTGHAPQALEIFKGLATFPTVRSNEPIVPTVTTARKPADGNLYSRPTGSAYTVSESVRPDVRHDNGFLQNPFRPSDRTPTSTQKAQKPDDELYAKEVLQAKAAKLLRGGHGEWLAKKLLPEKAHLLDLTDGIDAYWHFLTGKGAERTFDLEKYVSTTKDGAQELTHAQSELQKGVESLYKKMLRIQPDLAKHPFQFHVSGGASFSYVADSENWQKAIGGHTLWTDAEVRVEPGRHGIPIFKVAMTLHAEDRYNFNRGKFDVVTGELDAVRGRLEEVGLAHQYMQYGKVERRLEWKAGAARDVPIQGEDLEKTNSRK